MLDFNCQRLRGEKGRIAIVVTRDEPRFIAVSGQFFAIKTTCSAKNAFQSAKEFFGISDTKGTIRLGSDSGRLVLSKFAVVNLLNVANVWKLQIAST